MVQDILQKMKFMKLLEKLIDKWVYSLIIKKGMKYEPTADDVRSWINMTDSDGDGKVTLEDYENLVLKSL